MGPKILSSSQAKVLNLLSKQDNFTSNFYLSGGTALAEYYLHHRLSEDLDFFSLNEIDTIWLTAIANQIKNEINATKLDIQQSFNRNLVFFTLKKEILKTEFTYYPFTQIESPQIINNIPIDSLTDIAVNKFFTIYQKPSARHFIDLYFILQNKKINWNKLKKLARIKFDTHIDPLQLGSQLTTAQTISDLPNMINELNDHKWRNFFIKKALNLKKEIQK